MAVTVSILVKGKVQGVFFRKSTKEKAGELDITGEVKNTTDGHVAIIATGEKEQLDEFIDWCKRGPSRSRVDSIDVQETEARSFKEFSVVR